MTNTAKSEPFDRPAYERAIATWERDPGALTVGDLELIAVIDPHMADQADQARTKAAPANYSWRSKALPPAPVTPAPVAAGDPDGAPTRKQIEATVLPVLRKLHERLLDLETFADAMNTKNIERNARTLALEARLSLLEARPKGLTYGGIWLDGEAHAKDTLTTRSGSLWIAERDTVLQPGSPDSGWKMITKRGSIND